jgi:hypothetical protein
MKSSLHDAMLALAAVRYVSPIQIDDVRKRAYDFAEICPWQ